jgi:uncharacterized membrane protein
MINNTTTLINTKQRRIELDLARGFAIFMMVVIHSITFTGSSDVKSSGAAYFLNIIISMTAAPVFMFIMGILFGYSSNTSVRKNIMRGFLILLLGYGLNFFRGTLPILFGLWTGLFSEEDLDHSASFYMIENDILQFAGIAIIIMSVVRRVLPWKYSGLVSGLILTFIYPYVWQLTTDKTVVNYMITLFTGTGDYSYFPQLPWLVFPFIGMTYGTKMRISNDNITFYRFSFIIGLVAFVSCIMWIVLYDQGIWKAWYTGDYRQGQLSPIILLTFISFQLSFLPFCYFLINRLQDTTIIKCFSRWSNNVTLFYCIQWIIIGWLCIYFSDLAWTPIVIIIAGVLFITDRIIAVIVQRRTDAVSVK